MASDVLNLTAQIVISHASMTELTPKELVKEIKEVYSETVAKGVILFHLFLGAEKDYRQVLWLNNLDFCSNLNL